MAVGKEIKEQISSVQSTQKITSAMEKVAVSKMLSVWHWLSTVNWRHSHSLHLTLMKLPVSSWSTVKPLLN